MTLLDNAVTWAYTKKLTIYLNTDDFKPGNNIRRDEAAKFFVNFAKLVGKTSYTVNASQCNFSDLNQAWPDLKDIIVESCRLGIFKGSGGKFNPAGNLSNAEAIAVLVRIVDGYQSESGTHWADNYYKRANVLRLLENVNMNANDGSASRGNMVTLLYGARQMKGVNEKLTPNTITHNGDLILLYFTLLDQKKFAEAYALQYSSSPSIEKLQEYYGDATSIRVQDIRTPNCGHGIGEDNANAERWETLVAVTNAAGTSYYYGDRKIVQGKIQTISTQLGVADSSSLALGCSEPCSEM